MTSMRLSSATVAFDDIGMSSTPGLANSSSWSTGDSDPTVTSGVAGASSPLAESSVGVGDESDYFSVIWYEVTVPILYGLVTVLGVTGNSLVIYVIMTRERMRTVTNLLLLNLAIADLCFVVVIPPSTAYMIAANRWPFGDVACRLMQYFVNVTAYVTVYTLILIAVTRYMTIVHTASTARLRTSRHVIIAIVGVWILMLAVNGPVLISYTNRPQPKKSEDGNGATAVAVEEAAVETCAVVNEETGQWLYATFFAFAYLVPLCVIAGFSIGIVRHITRHKAPNCTSSVSSSGSGKSKGSHHSSSTGPKASATAAAAAAATNAAADASRKNSSHSANRKRQAGQMLVLVVVMFAVLWLPIQIHLLLLQFGQLPDHPIYEAISVLWNCLAYFNSCVNPIIYNRTSKEFRDAFLEACRCSSQNSGSSEADGSARGDANGAARRRSRSSSRSGVGRQGGGDSFRRNTGYSPSPDAGGRHVSIVTRLTSDGRRHIASAENSFVGGTDGTVTTILQRSATSNSDRLLSPPAAVGQKDADGVDERPEQQRRKSDFLTVPSALAQ